MEKVCQDCQQPLLVQYMKPAQTQPTGATDNASQSSGNQGLMSLADREDELKDSNAFHDVIDVQNTQVTNGMPESR